MAIIFIVLFIIGFLLAWLARATSDGVDNAIVRLDEADREQERIDRDLWMNMNEEDREWWNRYGS